MAAQTVVRRRAILSHNTAYYLHLHYGDFVRELVRRDFDVVVAAPLDAAATPLAELGARCVDITLSRQGVNPLRELGVMLAYYRLFRRERPAFVFNYSIKPVIYGALAAWLARVPHVYSMVTGLGYVFIDGGVRQRVLRRLVLPLYRLAIRCNDRVFFQNDDDLAIFRKYGLLDADKGKVVNGTGIDLEAFSPCGDAAAPATFLLVSRLLWSKGIREYTEAARVLKKRYPHAEFRLLGPLDDNPSAVQASDVEAWRREGAIDYLGFTDDVRPFLRAAAVFVLPSNYREGRPRSVLEAMAMGKPIVTTDIPGCRELVEEGVNGFTVPPSDASALADAMERFILRPELVSDMGRESRRIAEGDYDVRAVNAEVLEGMGDGLR